MALGVSGWVRRGLQAVQPPPRLVDWSIFIFVLVEAITGLLSFTIGTPTGWPVFWIHRIIGVTLIILLGFKLVRVRNRFLQPTNWRRSTLLSIVTMLAATGTILTGVIWVLGADIQVAHWTLLSVHIGFGLALIPLMIWHLSTRFRLPRRVDFESRRVALQFPLLILLGAVIYQLQRVVTHLLGGPGATRRFTGSQPREVEGNQSFPVTMWVADNPDPIDHSRWTLTVEGAVEDRIDLSYQEVEADSSERAVLDCTSGWYTVQDWSGLRVGDLLEAAGVTSSARFVRFVSARDTGGVYHCRRRVTRS